MAKVSLASILSGYNLSKINDNFDAIEAVLNDKVFWRDNPEGETNTVLQDMDMNSNDILNVGTLHAQSIDIEDLGDLSDALANIGSILGEMHTIEDHVEEMEDHVEILVSNPAIIALGNDLLGGDAIPEVYDFGDLGPVGELPSGTGVIGAVYDALAEIAAAPAAAAAAQASATAAATSATNAATSEANAAQDALDAQTYATMASTSATNAETARAATEVLRDEVQTIADGIDAITFQTNTTNNSSQTLLNLVAGTNVTLTESGGSVTIDSTGGGGSSLLVKTNGTNNSSQTVLNLAAGTNISLSESAGTVTITGTGSGGISDAPADGNTYGRNNNTWVLNNQPANTDALTEGTTNQYFTAARVRAVVLTGLSTATNAAITASDTVLGALGKLQAQITGFVSTVHTWTAAQRGSVTALIDAATISINFASSNNYSVTLGGNRTLANPSNISTGQSGAITITQDGTGGRTLAYGAMWKFPGGTAPTLSTAAGAVDVLTYYVVSGGFVVATLIKDVK